MTERWSEKKAWDWYKARPWITGCNFIPSNTINRVELWQEYEHETVMRQVRKEVQLAASIGFNSFRMSLPFFVWKHQREGFLKRLDAFLDMLEEFGITLMPVLFSDCCVPREMYAEPRLGKQKEPVPGYFGGDSVTPFDGTPKVGYIIADDEENHPALEAFVRDLAARYGKDKRIIMWNVWNEAGNCNRGTMSYPFMKKVFGWLREAEVIQPITADVCGLGGEFPYGYLNKPDYLSLMEEKCIELSDIVTFHFYGDYTHTVRYMNFLKRFDRPLLNTEWLHRPFRSVIQTHMPLFREENVGSYIFGFVNGKSQFHIVWEQIKNLPSIDTRLWMHDIYHSDFKPYNPKEIEVIKSLCLPK